MTADEALKAIASEKQDAVPVSAGTFKSAGHGPMPHANQYEIAKARATEERVAQDEEIAGWKTAENAALAQARDYILNQYAQNMRTAQGDAKAAYNRAAGELAPATATAQAMLRSGYQDAMGSAADSRRAANEAALNQWKVNRADLASRYRQQKYGNVQTMYGKANSDMWNQYESAINRENDLWGRRNTDRQQRLAQYNTDREHEFAREQWAKYMELQQQEIQLQKDELARQRAELMKR